MDTCPRSLDDPGWLDGILAAQAIQQLHGSNAQLSQPGMTEFYEEARLLHAQHKHFGDIGYFQHTLARSQQHLLHPHVIEAIGMESVNGAEGITKVIIEERPLDVFRQGVAYIADALARLVPAFFYLGLARAVVQH